MPFPFSFTVPPPTVSLLTLATASFYGGGSGTATVTLNGTAPAGGWVVDLVSTSSSAVVPSTVTVPAGARSATFPIATSPVAGNAVATITVGVQWECGADPRAS